MPAKKNIKTPYSKKNPVDIASLLTNLNISSTLVPFPNQSGGKRTNNKVINKDENNSDSDYESDTNSQYGKGKKGKGIGLGKGKGKGKGTELDDDVDVDDDEDDDDDDVDDDDDEPNAIPDVDDEVEADIDGDAAVVEEIEDEEENDDDDVEDNKSEASDDDKETLDTNNKCYSKYAKEKDDDFDLDEYFKDDDIVIMKTGRVGKPILFKYEKVRLLCDRSRQLAEGAKPMIKNTVGLSHKDIALLELKNKLIPLIIERPIPNAGSERWRLSELEIPEYD
jgi:DNA-directed RNA polymerase subunit K/omega